MCRVNLGRIPVSGAAPTPLLGTARAGLVVDESPFFAYTKAVLLNNPFHVTA